ncbi:phosphate ABC transporter substrate-binding protein PstS [Streptomyces flavofungini]|uniref:phosphate ABC transporter substrate-binding protein PstS n=1 Tax=Streptomyces flavofungini TaxID=68200 RepID=UPI0025B1D594|nr:phosphate ABC transporter substrate-binding protein PstS [Streptomyces flavofungini]WJV48949.1 phosphate ABC transporter substrate-binding protein PstS [Streptomyces flavofungini]
MAAAVVAATGGVLSWRWQADDGGSGASAASSAVARADCARSGKVPGSGSTAQQNAMKYWIGQYERACPPVRIAYNPLGSGAGVAQFMRGATAFGGSDTPVKPENAKPAQGVCPGGRAINLPMLSGPIALGYNVPGVEDLVLDARTLARIFDSKITTWDHPAIRRLNPKSVLPSMPIRAVHRSDDSGTTQNFQAYLAGAAPEVWSHPAEKAWQGRGGDSASGSDLAARTVNSTTGSIGYFELSFTTRFHMKSARIDTGGSEPVPATTKTASAGIAAAEVVGAGKDMTLKFDYRTSAAGTYPIVLVAYEIVCDKGNAPDTLPALKSFLTYTASRAGQRPLSRIHYAPLPESVAAEVREVVRTLR